MWKKIRLMFIIYLYLSVVLFNCNFTFISSYPSLPFNSDVTQNLIENTTQKEPNISEGSSVLTSKTKNEWNRTSDSSFNRIFQLEKKINQTSPRISLANCSDWDLVSDFNFTNIRSEKIINGNAENNGSLWTDFIPLNYEGNITREDSPPISKPISGNYSWYFDIQSENHTTIAGFDEPINVSSNSIIFSFSYSLLRNNLGTNYDSSICVRLFFQFDIYIFIWFNGDVNALSNVTGPGGYADILVNDATFDGSAHTYTLNISALGLELFNQKPDRLRSFAVQTWGELPYQMDFMLDDISLTDLVPPSTIQLKVNEQEVFGSEGKGFITLLNQGFNNNDFVISANSLNILWDCFYTIQGVGKSITNRCCAFESWEEILWEETFNGIISIPHEVMTIQISKYIPKNWLVDSIIVGDILTSFNVNSFNSTHKEIIFTIDNFLLLKMRFISENEMKNLLLNSYSVTHDDTLTITVDSNIYSQEIMFYIFNNNNELIFSGVNFTNNFGDSILTNIKFNSTLPKGTYYIFAFWSLAEKIGIGKNNFEIITSPTIINSKNLIIINYQEDFILEVDYQDLEVNRSIDYATVNYNWNFGSGTLQQTIDKKYSIKISPLDIIPGLYSLTVIASRESYATSIKTIIVKIVFEGFQLLLQAPPSIIPGGILEATSQVLNNNSLPTPDIKVRFKLNGNFYLDAWSNESGFATMYYFIPLDYSYLTINLSSSIVIGTSEFLTSSISITIDLSSTPKLVLLSEPIQKASSNSSVLFMFAISYPSIGSNWYVNIPRGFVPRSALIQSETKNFTATISPFGMIFWTKEITDTDAEHDLLLLEIPIPHPEIISLTIEKRIYSLEISIDTNGVPFSRLEVSMPRGVDSLQYVKWELYLNESLVTSLYELRVTQSFFILIINSSKEISCLHFKLVGTKLTFSQIPLSSIFLGLGTLILTGMSILLLVKKRKASSIDALQI